MRKKRYRRAKKGFGIITAVVLVLCGLVSYQKSDLNAQKASSVRKFEEREKELQDLKEEQEEIKEYEAYVQTKKYIEQIAREKLGLVYKDEIIFKAQE